MFRFFSRPVFGDPSSEMDAFLDHRKVTKTPVAAVQAPVTDTPEYEVGRIVGRRGPNFIVQVGDERREVPPTDIKRVVSNG